MVSQAMYSIMESSRMPLSGSWISAPYFIFQIKQNKFTEYLSARKGVWHEISSFKFFFMNQFPLAPEYPIRTVSYLIENYRNIRERMFISFVDDTGDKSENFEV